MTDAADETGRWAPLGLAAVGRLFEGSPFPWWVAGGLAIELAAGRSLRAHGDTDVLVLRVDQRAVRQRLRNWDCWVADPPGTLRPWRCTDSLPAAAHDVWCRTRSEGPWQLQLMFDESAGDRWVSRRNRAVSLRLDALTRHSTEGLPYLAPHVQLFYKAKQPRAKDDFDLEASLPCLSAAEAGWLATAIARAYGNQHAWIPRLDR